MVSGEGRKYEHEEAEILSDHKSPSALVQIHFLCDKSFIFKIKYQFYLSSFFGSAHLLLTDRPAKIIHRKPTVIETIIPPTLPAPLKDS